MHDLTQQVYRQRSKFFTRLFGIYSEWWIARNFHALRFSCHSKPGFSITDPLVVYSNHSAWWDPLIFVILAKRLFPEWAGYGPMDDRALEKYQFMKKLGIFGIDLNRSSGAKAFLTVCNGLLSKPGCMLWITAQGQFSDVRCVPMALRPGIAHLAGLRKINFIPLAIEYVFWEERYPEILVRMGEPFNLKTRDHESNKEILGIQEQKLSVVMNELADLSITREYNAFHTMIDGNKGIGGIYDWANQLRYFMTGRTYRAGHREIQDDWDH